MNFINVPGYKSKENFKFFVFVHGKNKTKCFGTLLYVFTNIVLPLHFRIILKPTRGWPLNEIRE